MDHVVAVRIDRQAPRARMFAVVEYADGGIVKQHETGDYREAITMGDSWAGTYGARRIGLGVD